MHTVIQQTFSGYSLGARPRAGCCWLGAERRVLHGGENHQVHPLCKGKWLRPSVHILSSPHPHPMAGPSVSFSCASFIPAWGASASPPHQQPFPALLSSASFDPFVKRLLEASEPLAILATSAVGLVTPQRLEPTWASLGMLPWETDGFWPHSFIHSLTHSAFSICSQAPGLCGAHKVNKTAVVPALTELPPQGMTAHPTPRGF